MYENEIVSLPQYKGLRPNLSLHSTGRFEHFYQPPRDNALVSQRNARASMLPQINFEIYWQCYSSMLVEAPFIGGIKGVEFPTGTVSSFYGNHREWMKANKPKSFEKIVKNINRWKKDKEYRMMGDPYLHFILPLASVENQDMWVKIGKLAFREDMGFDSAGFWPPETAISKKTMGVLFDNGYEFVALRNDQLEQSDRNPMFVPIRDEDGKVKGEMGVIHFDKELSGPVSFDPKITAHTETFLRTIREKKDPKETDPQKLVTIIGFDGELCGHHQPGKDIQHYYSSKPSVLRSENVRAFDAKKALNTNVREYTDVKDNTSWSCLEEHQLGRWTGDEECKCDGVHDQNDLILKRKLRAEVIELGDTIESMLDEVSLRHRLGNWRERYIDFVMGTRHSMFGAGDLHEDVNYVANQPGMRFLKDPQAEALFLGLYAKSIADISCIWFFGGADRVERELGIVNAREARTMVERAKSYGNKSSNLGSNV